MRPAANNEFESLQFSRFKHEYSQLLLEFFNINEDDLYVKLKVAVIKGQVEEIKTLLSDVDRIPETPENDVSLALYAFGRWNKDVRQEILEILIKKGLDTKARNEHGRNLLHEFLQLFSVSTDPDHLEITKILVRSGVCLNDAEGSYGLTPLMIAIQSHMKDVVSFFISQNDIDFNVKSATGLTVLHFAIAGGYSYVYMLMEAKDKIDINAEDDRGFTPLYLAKYRGNLNKFLVKLLLDNGANDLWS